MTESLTVPNPGQMLQQRLKSLAAFLYLPLGALIGFLAWGIGPELTPLLCVLALPLAWGMARSRLSAALLMAGYYLAGGRGLPVGAVVFFGDTAPIWWGWVMWATASILLAAPFVLLWTENRGAQPWRFVIGVCASSIPPLAIIGWVSPLTVAGVLFPGLGWVGLLLVLVTMGVLAARNWRWCAALGVLALVLNLTPGLADTKAPPHWLGVDTGFSRLSSAGTDDAGQLLSALQRVQWVSQFAQTVPENSVRVLPETVLGSFDGVADFALQEVEAALRSRGSRLLVGAELPQSNGQYKNVMMVLGARRGEDRAAVQNIPVPVAMWKPWAKDGAVANFFGRGNLIEVNGMRVGAVVCYEQVLTFPFWWLMSERPDVLVAISNVWWARETSVPAIQSQMVHSFGRLFGVAVVAAINS